MQERIEMNEGVTQALTERQIAFFTAARDPRDPGQKRFRVTFTDHTSCAGHFLQNQYRRDEHRHPLYRIYDSYQCISPGLVTVRIGLYVNQIGQEFHTRQPFTSNACHRQDVPLCEILDFRPLPDVKAVSVGAVFDEDEPEKVS